MESLFRSDFDSLTIIALWSIATVLVATLVLFVYTVGLRLATMADSRRRQAFVAEWRDVFALSMLDANAAATMPLPALRRADHVDLLEEWNRACAAVDGSAADNLVALAERTEIRAIAGRLLTKRRLRAQILALQTLGNLRDSEAVDAMVARLHHEDTALSITAAAAYVEVDAARAALVVVPMIDARRDWPKNRVSVVLRRAGSALISEPLYRAIRSADDDGKVHLLQYARFMESEILDALVSDLLRESVDPGVLNAALKLVSGFGTVPRIAALTQHPAWFVRMQAARVLGRVGQQEHVSLLVALLHDTEWWVRYRAGQAIARLPFLGPNQLRMLRAKQEDPFASDILQQCYAEVGVL